MHGNRINILNQLGLIFNPYSKQINVAPDLAIHAKGDDIVRFPDEHFYQADGDHFSLYTHPEQVLQEITRFLES